MTNQLRNLCCHKTPWGKTVTSTPLFVEICFVLYWQIGNDGKNIIYMEQKHNKTQTPVITNTRSNRKEKQNIWLYKEA
jgi:hypothetical protein